MPPTTAYRWASASDLDLPPRFNVRTAPPDLGDVAARFLAGQSVKSLAAHYDVARGTIVRWLRKCGIEQRGRSEAMIVRWEHASPIERERLVAAAHEAARGRVANLDELLARAASPVRAETQIRLGERDLAVMLQARGLDVTHQQAVGVYNVDLAAGRVAIEVHRSTGHPLRTAGLRQRADDIAAAGWRVLYIWCARGVRSGPGAVCFSDTCADMAVAHARHAAADWASVRPVVVLRCTGSLAP